MMKRSAAVEIGLLTYQGCQLSAVYGLSENFAFAERLAQERLDTQDELLWVSHLQYDEIAKSAVRIFSSRSLHDCKVGKVAPDIIIVPPSLSGLPLGKCVAPLAEWLAQRHAAGALLASICGGTFLLAQAGVLDNRSATTHWAHANILAEHFRKVRLHIDKLIIDDGDIITVGGTTAWIDLGLRIIDRLLGPAAMTETAQYLLVAPPSREQRLYSSFSPKLNHGDNAILKVQHWLRSQGARKITVSALAECAALEERTFLRRFQRATGLRPTEYLQHLRVGRARQMLESSSHTINQIAWDVGYKDATAFRAIFIKVTGMSPVNYRETFRADIDRNGAELG